MTNLNLGFKALAGDCLAMAQGITGAPVMYGSATEAANATKYRHYNRDLPPDQPCVLWFDHYGSYGEPGQEYYKNWGHVAVWVPGHGIASSSPNAGRVEGPYFYRSIEAVERAFGSTFRFWSEDINGKRVTQIAAPAAWEDTLKQFSWKNERKTNQVIPAGAVTTLTYRQEWRADLTDSTVVRGPGDVFSATATIRMKGKPGSRVEFKVIAETGANKNRRDLAEDRRVFDSAGLCSITLPFDAHLGASELVRVVAHVQAGAGSSTVENFYGSGFARA